MPRTAAALAGISANGHRWRLSLNLQGQPARLGDEASLKVGDCGAIRDAIVKRVRQFLTEPATKRTLDEDDIFDIENCVDDLEMVDDDVEEVRYALNDLYDKFDYYRICVVR